MNWYQWLIVIVPIFFVLYMAVYSHRYARSVADYLVAGRVAGRYVLSASGMMDSLAVIYVVAGAEASYQTGWAMGFWNNLLMPLGLFLGLFGYVSVRFRQTRAMSGGQYLEMRYSRRFRVFATCVRVFGEMLTNCIGPAVSARFFIYLLGIPHRTHIFGWTVPTFPLFLAVCLALALVIILSGGRIALVIADAIQGIIAYPVFVILVVFVFTEFSWSDQVIAVAADRIPGESFLNPYDVKGVRDFNMFALVASVVGRFFRNYAWIGNDHSGMGRSPHEQKMAGILGNWRAGLSSVMVLMLVLTMVTLMNHADFADRAHTTRQELATRVIDEIAGGDTPAFAKAVAAEIGEIPAEVHRIGVDPPLARRNNLDTVFQGTPPPDAATGDADRDARRRRDIEELERQSGPVRESRMYKAFVERADLVGGEAAAKQKYQNFRSLYNQMMLPVTLRHFLPPALLALCFMIMVLMMVSTDDSRIFNSASALVQDLVLPFMKRPPSPRAHLLLLKGFTVLVCGVFFVGAIFLSQLDFINLFLTITTSIWEVGGGIAVVLGLYWRRGTTAGAYASIIAGGGLSGLGMFVQRTWAKSTLPWLVSHGLDEGFRRFLEVVSRPLNPWVKWEVSDAEWATKFPVNSTEIAFFAAIMALLAYVSVSLATCRRPYDLDWLLHRGKWAVEGDGAPVAAKPRPFWKRLCESFVNITPEYTRGDKIIAWSVFFYSIVYKFGLAFVGVLVWNAISPWKPEWWGNYFLVTSLAIPSIAGVITTIWFMWGGIKDIKALLRDLETRKRDALDNGMVGTRES